MLSLSDENIGDQKDKKVILLKAAQIPHPSAYWSIFSVSPCKSSLFMDLLVCNKKRRNFPCPFASVFFSSFLHNSLLFSSLLLDLA